MSNVRGGKIAWIQFQITLKKYIFSVSMKYFNDILKTRERN